jgi:hypothetical protein
LEQQLHRVAEERHRQQLDASEYVLHRGWGSSVEEVRTFDLSAACAAADGTVGNGVLSVPTPAAVSSAGTMADEDAELEAHAVAGWLQI